MRFSLRTLLVLLIVMPPLAAGVWRITVMLFVGYPSNCTYFDPLAEEP